MIDISVLDVVKTSNEGFEVEIKNPKTYQPMGLKIKVKGMFADNFRDEMSKRAENADDEAATSEFLADFTLGWSDMLENGKQVVFSRNEAARVYKQYPIIRGQVWREALNISNFIKD